MSMRRRAVARRMTRGDGERGVTLIELIVTMILLGVVSTLVVTAVVQSSQILRHNDDEEKGLQDAKVILDRLGRDVRESRQVVCDGSYADPNYPSILDPTCTAHLQLWIDSNSDYVEEPTEVVTWRLIKDSDGVHWDVLRYVGSGAGGTPVTSQREASTLIAQIAFTYDSPTFTLVNQVSILVRYDAVLGGGSGIREVASSVRLRNKG